jgi:HK97 gp10 family phage protein
MANEFSLHGLDGALAKMRAISRDVATKGTRAAGTRAMRIVRDAARARARQLDDPKTASNIAKAITTRYDGKASKREGGVVVKVGVVGGAKPRKGDEDMGHWRLLEFGTSQMRAQPFMRPALEQNVDAVTDAFVQALEPAIDKAIAKANR